MTKKTKKDVEIEIMLHIGCIRDWAGGTRDDVLEWGRSLDCVVDDCNCIAAEWEGDVDGEEIDEFALIADDVQRIIEKTLPGANKTGKYFDYFEQFRTFSNFLAEWEKVYGEYCADSVEKAKKAYN